MLLMAQSLGSLEVALKDKFTVDWLPEPGHVITRFTALQSLKLEQEPHHDSSVSSQALKLALISITTR